MNEQQRQAYLEGIQHENKRCIAALRKAARYASQAQRSFANAIIHTLTHTPDDPSNVRVDATTKPR